MSAERRLCRGPLFCPPRRPCAPERAASRYSLAGVGVAVPESKTVGLPETESGAIALTAAEQIIDAANTVEAVLIGPGMEDPDAVTELFAHVAPHLNAPTVVLDAAALAFVCHHCDGLHH